LAPSPIAIARRGSMPMDAHVSSSIFRFSAPSQMSPHGWSTMRPVNAPSRISSTLLRVKSMPRRSRTRSLKNVKPPETRSVFSPAVLHAATRRSAPGLKRNRSSYTCSSAVAGTLRSSATRRRRLSL
jgi:hypothetical protein